MITHKNLFYIGGYILTMNVLFMYLTHHIRSQIDPKDHKEQDHRHQGQDNDESIASLTSRQILLSMDRQTIKNTHFNRYSLRAAGEEMKDDTYSDVDINQQSHTKSLSFSQVMTIYHYEKDDVDFNTPVI